MLTATITVQEASAMSTTDPRSRRALLGAGLGALAATVASALARPQTALALNPDLVLDQDNDATATTSLHQNTSGQDGLYVATAGAGTAAIFGEDYAGYGVKGSTTTGTGVFGVGTTSGTAVLGTSDSGVGVDGNSTSNDGVRGISIFGTGVYASTGPGYALQAVGRVKFETSGVATIAAGSTSKRFNPGVHVSAASFVLLTPGTDIGTRRLWFTKSTSTNTITIHLSSSRTKATKISWLLLG